MIEPDLSVVRLRVTVGRLVTCRSVELVACPAQDRGVEPGAAVGWRAAAMQRASLDHGSLSYRQRVHLPQFVGDGRPEVYHDRTGPDANGLGPADRC
jgi:hypothetical protein